MHVRQTMKAFIICALAIWGSVIELLFASQSGQMPTTTAKIAESLVREENAYLGDTILTVRANELLTGIFVERLRCEMEIVDVLEGGVRNTGDNTAILDAIDHPQMWRVVVEPATHEAFKLRGFRTEEFAVVTQRCGFKIETSQAAA